MSAVISADAQYRYTLTRFLTTAKGNLCFIMLNPSTADATYDDATIRRCIGWCRKLGVGGLIVVNLYAYRSRHPDDLYLADDPVGPLNDEYIDRAVEETTGPVIAAWGAHPLAKERAPRILKRHAGRLMCLEKTVKYGDPKHPLYTSIRNELKPYP